MKASERNKYRIRKIRTMEDLKQEQTRLKYEIVHAEDRIRNDYKDLISMLTFRNIVANLTQEFAVTSSIVSKAVEAGRAFFAKKKKKKKKNREDQGEPPPPGEDTGEIAGEQ